VVPAGVCIHEFAARIHVTDSKVPERDHDVGEHRHSLADPTFTVEQDADEPGFEEERSHDFHRDDDPDDRAHRVGVAAPVEAELEGQDYARDHP